MSAEANGYIGSSSKCIRCKRTDIFTARFRPNITNPKSHRPRLHKEYTKCTQPDAQRGSDSIQQVLPRILLNVQDMLALRRDNTDCGDP